MRLFNLFQLLAFFLSLFSYLTRSFMHSYRKQPVNCNELKAKISAEDRSLLNNCQVLIAVPLASVPVNELTNLKKGLPKSSTTSVLPMNDIIELVDGTPYCIMGSVVTGVNLCIFITNNEDYEYFNNWMKKMTSLQNFIACKKGHLIRYK